MSKIYAVYDTKDYEQCVRVFDNVKQISDYFNMSKRSVLSEITRKNKIKHRYLVERIEDTEEHEEKFTVPVKKTDKEIFQELIDAFVPVKPQFELFDEFKWKLKGMKDKVIIDEEWKRIDGVNYSISNYGRIRNDKTKKLKNPRYHRWILQVDIYENAKRYTCDVTRLVAHYFIKEISKNERVRHRDGDVRNNYYKNLEIVSK